jgi:3-deoxy-7-phosphoheptulonate synthase
MDRTQIDMMCQYVDILQVGARNMQNFDLLKDLGKIRKPVLLKRGLAATIEELLLSAEYILAGGNTGVLLCERGIRTFERATRNTLDISAIPVLKSMTHLPIVVDPSHAVGIRDKVPPVARAAVAAGADGLLIEVHHEPDRALCDGAQSLLPPQLERLSRELKVIAEVIGRSM